jgi:hypothetical protein
MLDKLNDIHPAAQVLLIVVIGIIVLNLVTWLLVV